LPIRNIRAKISTDEWRTPSEKVAISPIAAFAFKVGDIGHLLLWDLAALKVSGSAGEGGCRGVVGD
jgi:hypothetical protein